LERIVTIHAHVWLLLLIGCAAVRPTSAVRLLEQLVRLLHLRLLLIIHLLLVAEYVRAQLTRFGLVLEVLKLLPFVVLHDNTLVVSIVC